MKERFK